MNDEFKGMIFFRKPNGEIGIRELHPSARVVKKCSPVKPVSRRAASTLKGSKFGASTWWFGEPEIHDAPDSNHESAHKNPMIYLEVY